jgi:predicted solute-binding protein
MLRVGAVSYLNTRPLIYGLQQRLQGMGTLSLNLPSRLADELAAGSLDVALVPSIEYFRGAWRGYRIVSDAAIACRGPVWSVRLLSRVPVAQVRSLALDVGSRTSHAVIMARSIQVPAVVGRRGCEGLGVAGGWATLPARHSAFAAAIRSRDEWMKFHHM